MEAVTIPTETAGRFRLKDRAALFKSMFVFLSIISILWNTWDMSKLWLQTTDIMGISRALPLSGMAEKVDYLPTMSEIARHQTFLSTFEWWHRSFAGDVPFWRPLTSQAWWLEMHWFSFDRLDKYQWVTITSHLLVVGLLSLLMRKMTGHWSIGVLTAVLFAGSRAFWPITLAGNMIEATPANVSLGEWKFQQDIWASDAILGCLICVCDRRWILALVCAFVSVCFKETGWLSFPLALIVLIALRRLKQVPWWGYGATLVTIVTLIGLRASSGSAVMHGYQIGTNAHWLVRYLNAMGGPVVKTLLGAWAPLVFLATAALVLLLWTRGNFLLRFVLGLVAITLTGIALGHTMETSWDAGLQIIFDSSQPTLHFLVRSFVWLLLAYYLIRDKTLCSVGVSFVFMSLLSALALVAATQVQIHVMYVAYQFSSAAAALAMMAVLKVASRLVLTKRLANHA